MIYLPCVVIMYYRALYPHVRRLATQDANVMPPPAGRDNPFAFTPQESIFIVIEWIFITSCARWKIHSTFQYRCALQGSLFQYRSHFTIMFPCIRNENVTTISEVVVDILTGNYSHGIFLNTICIKWSEFDVHAYDRNLQIFSKIFKIL